MPRSPYKRGDRITYRSGAGFLFSARVEAVHRNDQITVKVLFPLDRDGNELDSGYVGDKFRIGDGNIVKPLAP